MSKNNKGKKDKNQHKGKGVDEIPELTLEPKLKHKKSNGITVVILPKTIPEPVRKCFVETINNLTELENDAKIINRNNMRIGHMINSAFIAESICTKSRMSVSNSNITIIAALFHDIFKLTSVSSIKWSKILDIPNNDKSIYDMHPDMGATMTMALFNMYADDICLTELEINKIGKAIRLHSDKYDTMCNKTKMEKIVIEADLLEKIGICTMIKVINKSSVFTIDSFKILATKYSEFCEMSSIFKTAYSIKLYKERLSNFEAFIKKPEVDNFY